MMQEALYTITRADHPGHYLKGLGIGCCNAIHPDRWTVYEPYAIRFNFEEAEATIKFITDVIDFELGEQLVITTAKWIPERF